ncbi:MAG: sulfatase [Verrucomicrobiales bacterium]|nr:sulfatase [Verrucomicrobiales bacterium]
MGLQSAFSAEKQPNILVILTDDQRYDAMGFLDHPFLKTPHIDRIAREGVYLKNACVTTSLCSPSRASILTGLYAHNHRVVDNYNPIPDGLRFFPEYLQEAGYETAFIGKWHMGGMIDHKQPGFDHWISFKGQGVYFGDPDEAKVKGRYVPQVSREGFNVNGKQVPQEGYITDILDNFSRDWIEKRDKEKPWMLYLSHKAVHADFLPANRHAYSYEDAKFERPKSWFESPSEFFDVPMWVQNQRNSRHGVEFAYYTNLNIETYYKRYCETIRGIDESTGNLIKLLEERGELDNTLILYLGDNGFLFGEHGLIDKRCAYEASIRIPMVMRCPSLFKGGQVVDEVVANIDVAPTLLEAAGIEAPGHMDGESFLGLAKGEEMEWRDYLLYEYYWERNYPQTPTMHAVCGKKYKYVRYHGIWDIDELYDLENDPGEKRNLINDPAHAETVTRLNKRLFELLKETRGTEMPLLEDRGTKFLHRKKDGSRGAEFPDWFYREPEASWQPK